MIDSQQLVYGDNQFLLQIDSLDLPLRLYFIYTGRGWFFRGLSGYVADTATTISSGSFGSMA